MSNSANPISGSSASLTAWQRWRRMWAFYRTALVGWFGTPLGIACVKGPRRKSRQPRRRLEVWPVYDTLEPRIVPTHDIVATLEPGIPIASTGGDAMSYIARVRTEEGQDVNNGVVELRDRDVNDALVAIAPVRAGSAQFFITYWPHGFDGLHVVYVAADASTGHAAEVSPSQVKGFGQLPLRFEQNDGQFDDRVQFTSRGNGYDLYLTKSEAVMVLPVGDSDVVNADGSPRPGEHGQPMVNPQPQSRIADVVRMQLVGANLDATAKGSSPLITRSNYFIGNDSAKWHVDIPNYAKVTYDDVYPGIDLVYYGSETERQLEFDFQVASGADPNVIRMQLSGAENLKLDSDGNLVVTTANHLTLVQKAPVVYQDKGEGRQAIFGSYTLEPDGGVGFQLGDYDVTMPLIIDPVWAYGTYLGGSDSDQGAAVATDPIGNAYIAGWTYSADFPATGGSSSPYGIDAFVAKYNSAGDQLIFANYMGGTDGSHSYASGVAVGPSGNVFLTGYTSTDDFPLKNPLQSSHASQNDVFVCKFDPTGSLLNFSTLLGGDDNDFAYGIAVNSKDEPAVTGQTQSSDYPTYFPNDSTLGGAYDAFVTHLSADGDEFIFSSYVGEYYYESAKAIAFDNDDAIVIAGEAISTLPQLTPLQSTYSGGMDSFIARIGAAGAITAATFVGGSNDDTITSLAIDKDDNIFVAGSTNSADFPITASVLQTALAGGADGFVAKINSTLTSRLLSTFIGGNGSDAINGVAVDSAGKITLAGVTSSTNFPLVAPLQTANAGGQDAVFAKLNPTASALLFSTYAGTSSSDAALGVAADLADDVVITGYAGGSSFLPTSYPLQSGYAGSSDAFVAKFGAAPKLTSISNDSGNSNSDFLTDDRSLMLYGTADASSTVNVYRAGVGLLGTASADSGGNWTYDYTATNLPEGVTAFTFTSTLGGVTSSDSKPYYVTVDRTAPTLAVNVVPSGENDRKPLVMVTSNDANGVLYNANVSLNVDLNNDLDFNDPSETSNTSGSMNYAGTLGVIGLGSALAAGSTVRIQAVVTDAAGNTGSSTPVTFNVPSTQYTDTIALIASDKDHFQASRSEGSRGIDFQSGTLTAVVPLKLDRSPMTSPAFSGALVYNSGTVNVRPIVQAAIKTQNDTALPASYSAQLTWNGGSPQSPQSYSTSASDRGPTLVVGQQVSSAVTTTGRYTYTLAITPAGGATTSRSGSTFVVAEDASLFGLGGWFLSSVDRLYPISASGGYAAGLLRVYGTGDWAFYTKTGTYTYTSPAGDFGTMAGVVGGDGGYTYALPTGEVWTFNSTGLETSFTSADSQAVTAFTYTGSGPTYLETITAPDGQVTTFSYFDDRLYHVDGADSVAVSVNGSFGVNSSIIAIRSREFTYGTHSYDAQRIVSDTWGSAVSTYSYSASGALSGWTDGAGSEAGAYTLEPVASRGLSGFGYGNQWTNSTGPDHFFDFRRLDNSGRRLEKYTADGAHWVYGRNSTTGLISTVTDPLNQKTTYTYDASGAVTQITFPDGNSQSFEYQSGFHALTTFTDERGKVTAYSYDGGGHRLTETQHLGTVPVVTTYTYNSPGLLETLTDPIGRLTTYQYDSERRLTTITYVDGSVQEYAYDAAGHVATMIDARGNTFTYAHDALGRLTSWLDGEGHGGSITNDYQGNVTFFVDELGVETTREYSTRGQLRRSVQGDDTPLARVTELITYDTLGHPLYARDGRGNSYKYSYDGLGQNVKTTDPNGGAQRNVFDWAGQLTQAIDALGFASTYGYNARGWQSAMTYATGDVVTNAYDTAGNLTTVTDARNHNWLTAYDDLDRATVATDPLSHAATTAYDKVGNVTAVTDANSKITTTVYDFTGRTAAVTDPLTHKITYTFDQNANAIAYQDARGAVATTVFDKNNRAVGRIDFRNKTTTLTLDDAGNVYGSQDPLGHSTTVILDALGRAAGVTDAYSHSSTSILNPLDQAVTTIDPNSHSSVTAPDALGLIVASRDAMGGITKLTYDANGNLIKTVDPLGNVTRFDYDKRNRRIKTTDAAGNVNQSSYDASGNLSVATDGNGKRTTYTYDNANRLINVQSPVGLTTNTYTNTNLLETVTDPNGLKTTFTYDDAGHQTKVTYADGSSVLYHYDNNGNRDRITDANGNVTTFTFNANNQVETTVDPFNKTTTYEYDDAGRNTAIVDRLGHRRDFAYDDVNRMYQETWLWGTMVINTITFDYDFAGNLTDAESDDGGNAYAYTLQYDKLNRPTYVEEPFSKVLTFTYDAASNRTRVQDSDGGVITSTFNSLNLLASRQMTDGNGHAFRVDLAYSNRNQLATLTRYDDLAGSTKVGEASYGYDDAMRLTSVNHKNGSSTSLASYIYTYDVGSRLSTQKISAGAVTTFTYDNANQLSNDGTTTWTYDPSGNRTSSGSTPTTGNRLTTDGTYSYIYDDESNVIQKTDGAGNHWNYNYDYRNQLTEARYYNVGGTLIQRNIYTYGPFGERLTSFHDESGSSNDFTREYAYDAWNPQKAGSEGNSAWDVWADLDGGGTITTRYLDGDGIDDKWARVTPGSTEQWLLTDRQGTIRDLTNSSGTLVNTINYDPWGKVLSQTSGGGANDLGRYAYTGRERDADTGLQYHRGRYYDPTSGRWLTQDPKGFGGGDANLNRYVGNGPTNGTDPSGLAITIDRSTDPPAVFSNGALIGYLHNGNVWRNIGRDVLGRRDWRVVPLEEVENGTLVNNRTYLNGWFRYTDPSWTTRETAPWETEEAAPRTPGPLAGSMSTAGPSSANFLKPDINDSGPTDMSLGLPDWQANVRADIEGIDRPPTFNGSLQMYGLDGNQNMGGAMVQGGWLMAGMNAPPVVALGAMALSPLIGCGALANFASGFGASVISDTITQVTAINVGLQTEFSFGQAALGGLLGGVLQWFGAPCFSGDTKLIARGPWGEGLRRIDAITTSDEVLARPEDDPSAPAQWKRVEELFRRSGFMLQLRVGGQVIRTTSEHPFYVQGKGWLPAAELQRGDLLSSHDGRWAAVEEVFEDGNYEVVYNLRISEFHTYFVGGEDWGFSVWAHNLHGNCAASTKPQHGYVIYDSVTGSIWKYGISGGKISAVGASYRAQGQVNQLNTGGGTWTSGISAYFSNRKDALAWELAETRAYQVANPSGARPPGMMRP